jgi:hypothetical protein
MPLGPPRLRDPSAVVNVGPQWSKEAGWAPIAPSRGRFPCGKHAPPRSDGHRYVLTTGEVPVSMACLQASQLVVISMETQASPIV